MHFAYKKAYLALFAMSALVAVFQPKEVHASTSNNEAKNGVSSAVETYCEASDIPLTGISSYMPKTSFISFSLNNQLVYDMRSVKLQVDTSDKAVFATAKVDEVRIEAPDTLSQSEILKTEVKAEAVEPVSTELNADTLLGLINEHRIKIGLSALEKEENLMQIARERAPELFDEIFVNGNMHAGFYSRNLPYRATENIIYNQSEAGAFRWWLNSSVHRAAIQSTEHTHTGIACSGKACAQIFTSFKPR